MTNVLNFMLKKQGKKHQNKCDCPMMCEIRMKGWRKLAWHALWQSIVGALASFFSYLLCIKIIRTEKKYLTLCNSLNICHIRKVCRKCDKEKQNTNLKCKYFGVRQCTEYTLFYFWKIKKWPKKFDCRCIQS